MLFSFLLLRAQKKKQEKGTPASPGPAGFPYFSPRAGRGKTRASPSNSRSLRHYVAPLTSRVFSAPVCEARQDKWGGRKEFPLARRRAPQRLPKRGFALFEAKPSLQSPGSIEEHRVSRLRRDKGHRGPFLLVRFLWASKENEQTNFLRHAIKFQHEPKRENYKFSTANPKFPESPQPARQYSPAS